jgi:hypothetical protein
MAALGQPTMVCAGQAVTLTAAAAATGFTWLPGGSTTSSLIVTPTITTIYTVSATDGTCNGVANVTVVANPNPTITIVGTSTAPCQNADVTMTVTGGNSYTWNPSNLTGSVVTVNTGVPTLYSVQGSNSFGCTSGANYVIVPVASPTVSAVSNKTMSCAGATVILSAGGAGTYTWSTGATGPTIAVTPTVNSVYTVTGTSTNGCTSVRSLTVNVLTGLLSIAGSNTVCTGVSSTLTASGGGGYQWTGGPTGAVYVVSPTVATAYTVTATTQTPGLVCQESASKLVSVVPSPTVTTNATSSVICKGDKLTITASGANTYSWSTTATTSTVLVSPSNSTNYIVTGYDPNGCMATASYSVKVNNCVGLSEYAREQVYSVYPNPSNGEFTVKANAAKTLILVNSVGQLIKAVELNAENNYETKFRLQAKGIYFLNDTAGENNPVKVVVE